MIEQTSSDAIGQYGFTHYTRQPINPHVHGVAFVPQSIADGWEALCSCGEWRAFASFYEYPTKAQLLRAMTARFNAHKEAAVAHNTPLDHDGGLA